MTAPLLWPAIFLGAVSLTRGGGDSCDRVYDGDWASRDAEFRAMQMMQVIGSGVMIAIGCALIAVLIARRRRISRIRLTLAIVATAVMILAYLGMIAVSGYSTDCLV
ncbi:hypothetical protein [Mycobacterium sp. NPDC050041]|uniref:hypothetical protein n=1 Tax=Mycobacterium sp. NPDC050041 TaxID=3364293 RepID=UPI003C2CA1DD